MAATDPSTLVLLILTPLLAWRGYARFRRLVGRQRLSRLRPRITLTVFPTLLLALAYAALPEVGRLGWMAGGLAGGALLARYGLGRTRFEPTPQGLFYTPNAHLGIALSLLFLLRLVYRLVEVYLLDSSADGFLRSPLTLALFSLLAGYYIAYALGLVRWRRRVLAAKRRREAAPPPAG